MLDNSTVQYILDYYGRFMSIKEHAAMMHSMTLNRFSDNAKDLESFYEKGWLSRDSEVLALIKDGYEQFRLNTAQRILEANPGKIYFNNCPKCGKLSRTPFAKQCRFCGLTWHDHVAGTFQIASAFQITGRQFLIAGDILSGKVRKGMKVDLVSLGLAIKPVITAVGSTLHEVKGVEWKDVTLELSDITDDDKEFLTSKCPILTPVFIEK